MIQNIFRGIQAYAKAFPLISKLKLWKYFAIPIAISIITAIVVGTLAYSFSDNIGHYIANFWKWEFGKKTFEVISTFLSGLLIVAVGLVLYKHIVMALSAPFMSPVSEKIEKYLKGDNQQHRVSSFQEQLIRGIRINVRNLFRELFLTIPILLLGFIPVIGFLSTIILFIMQAYYAGFGNMDYTLERHYKYKESIDFVWKNKGVAIGNGLVFIVFLLIPVVGVILVLPLSVTAATTETIKKIHSKDIIE
ncbi:EI24 domain-containing protein [Tenacibaculum sp. TC6]|uniref:EI24 domain-containing protein n=1 Tax=Tenacibaculum sp. TC6 TaxID=3423223 RepID=UPI003D365DCD